MLDENPAVDRDDAATARDQKPTPEIANLVDPCSPSPTSSRVLAEPDNDNEKSAQSDLIQYNTDIHGDGEAERVEDQHEDEVLHDNVLARSEVGSEGSGNDGGIDAPASTGRIHDVFAEYERTFSMPKGHRRARRSALHDCQNRDMAADSTPRRTRHEEPQAVDDVDATSIEHPVKAVGEGVGPGKSSSKETENESVFVPGRESSQRGDRNECFQVSVCFHLRERLPLR